ncbi:MAG: hypothetical protein RPU64_05040 [Candidatus Sedimenticola sp. (ex Thyasira tokunagai)]
METQNTLALHIPERSTAPVDAFLSKPKAVEDWVKHLPMANVGETSRQVFKALVELNRLETPSQSRIKVAELFRRPVSYISSNLRKYYFDVSFPLSAKNRKIAILNRELYSELAIAYKIFIENMISGKAGKFDKKLLIISIHRAIRYLSLTLYHSAIIYEPYPKYTWEEIHKLYAYAERNKIHDLPIKEASDQQSSSINELYKQVLLFSACAPYNLRQREIEHVFNKLPEWAALISLDSVSNVSDQPGLFISDLRSDTDPIHAKLFTNTINKQCRLLNLQELIKTLKVAFDDLPAELSSSDTRINHGHSSKYLLRQLIQALSTTPTREFVRTRLNFELKIAVGLNAIYALITENLRSSDIDVRHSQDQDDQWPEMGEEQSTIIYTTESNPLNITASTLELENNSAITESKGSGSIQPEHRTPSWASSAPISEETIISGSVGGRGLGPGDITPSWAAPDMLHEHETFSCKTINESAGGYCINWHGANAPQIKVGEILGIQSATGQHQFSIGITRWMKNGPRKNLQIGMQVIAPNSVAIQARLAGKSDYSKIPQKCLLLPELKAAGQPATLITPTLPFKVKDSLWINDSVGQQKIRLTRLLESTGALSQFQFVYLHDQNEDETEESNEMDEGFDNIWSML